MKNSFPTNRSENIDEVTQKMHISIINIFCIVCRVYSKQVTSMKDQVKEAVSMRKMKALYVTDGKVLSEKQHRAAHFVHIYALFYISYLCKLALEKYVIILHVFYFQEELMCKICHKIFNYSTNRE